VAMRICFPVLLLLFAFASCASTEPLERKIKEQDQELQKLRSAESALQSENAALKQDAERARTDARTRAAQIDMIHARFSPLEKPGRLKLKLVDGRIVVVLSTDVLFDVGRADLSLSGKKELSAVAEACAELKDMRFQVEGHTDNVPIGPGIEFRDNWQLGSGRAIAVVNLMLAKGVAPARVSAASFADSRPVKSNQTAEGRAANRRIEIIIVPDLSQVPQFDFLKAGTEAATPESAGKQEDKTAPPK
jgi:chemotaxis protein MotB